jgi:hypothetical protein
LKYGRIRDIDLKTPGRPPAFAFIAFEDYRGTYIYIWIYVNNMFICMYTIYIIMYVYVNVYVKV